MLAHGAEATIAMEYLDGQPLTRVMNRLRGTDELSVPLRLRILMSVLAGLEHAHNLTDLEGKPLELVHRDVSPHNVFVTYDGQVKLVDFGVAKTLAASHHTRPGALKGKLAYMAPEQLQPVEVDRRADLFSVGVMLWEMLAGKRLWQGMNEVQIVSQLAAGLPFPPLPLDAGIPPGLDSICEQALHPNPRYRYQTAAEMEEDLERALIGLEDSHPRSLGRVVLLAFAVERAERQGLIEASSRLEVGADLPMAPPVRDAEIETTPPPAERTHTPAQPIVVEATPVQATPAQATTAVDVGVSARTVERRPVSAADTGAPTPVPEAATGRHLSARVSSWGRRVWLRRTVVVAGLMAIAALLVRFDGGAKRLVFVGHVARRGTAGPAPLEGAAAPLPARCGDPPGAGTQARGARALLRSVGGARRRRRCARLPVDPSAAAPPRAVAG